jgi:hypothetical protein
MIKKKCTIPAMLLAMAMDLVTAMAMDSAMVMGMDSAMVMAMDSAMARVTARELGAPVPATTGSNRSLIHFIEKLENVDVEVLVLVRNHIIQHPHTGTLV